MKLGFMRRLKVALCSAVAGAAMLCSSALPAKADVLNDFSDAIKAGTPTLELRLGFEHSDLQDNGKHPANGFNLRTRLGYRTGEFFKTSAYVQFHNLTNFEEEFSDGTGDGDLSHDVIADPDGSRIHQAYLDFKMLPDTVVRLGRQEIIMDDHRLIGDIDWRQNGQSFDAVSVTNNSIKDTTLYAAYINQVNTTALKDEDLDGLYLFHATYKGLKDQTLSAFVYLLDTEDESDAARDCATYGLRAAGKIAMIDYAVDYAHQSDFADGEDHDADMVNLFVATKVYMAKVGVGYSYISGQDGNDRPFDTLFSTTHKFNGWADQFLSTNGGNLRDGLQDFYIQAGTDYMGFKFLAVYHYFDTAENDHFDGTYGDEIDLLLTRKLTKNLSGLLKYAYYNKDDNEENGFANPTSDEQVFWARLTYSF